MGIPTNINIQTCSPSELESMEIKGATESQVLEEAKSKYPGYETILDAFLCYDTNSETYFLNTPNLDDRIGSSLFTAERKIDCAVNPTRECVTMEAQLEYQDKALDYRANYEDNIKELMSLANSNKELAEDDPIMALILSLGGGLAGGMVLGLGVQFIGHGPAEDLVSGIRRNNATLKELYLRNQVNYKYKTEDKYQKYRTKEYQAKMKECGIPVSRMPPHLMGKVALYAMGAMAALAGLLAALTVGAAGAYSAYQAVTSDGEGTTPHPESVDDEDMDLTITPSAGTQTSASSIQGRNLNEVDLEELLAQQVAEFSVLKEKTDLSTEMESVLLKIERRLNSGNYDEALGIYEDEFLPLQDENFRDPALIELYRDVQTSLDIITQLDDWNLWYRQNQVAGTIGVVGAGAAVSMFSAEKIMDATYSMYRASPFSPTGLRDVDLDLQNSAEDILSQATMLAEAGGVCSDFDVNQQIKEHLGLSNEPEVTADLEEAESDAPAESQEEATESLFDSIESLRGSNTIYASESREWLDYGYNPIVGTLPLSQSHALSAQGIVEAAPVVRVGLQQGGGQLIEFPAVEVMQPANSQVYGMRMYASGGGGGGYASYSSSPSYASNSSPSNSSMRPSSSSTPRGLSYDFAAERAARMGPTSSVVESGPVSGAKNVGMPGMQLVKGTGLLVGASLGAEYVLTEIDAPDEALMAVNGGLMAYGGYHLVKTGFQNPAMLGQTLPHLGAGVSAARLTDTLSYNVIESSSLDTDSKQLAHHAAQGVGVVSGVGTSVVATQLLVARLGLAGGVETAGASVVVAGVIVAACEIGKYLFEGYLSGKSQQEWQRNFYYNMEESFPDNHELVTNKFEDICFSLDEIGASVDAEGLALLKSLFEDPDTQFMSQMMGNYFNEFYLSDLDPDASLTEGQRSELEDLKLNLRFPGLATMSKRMAEIIPTGSLDDALAFDQNAFDQLSALVHESESTKYLFEQAGDYLLATHIEKWLDLMGYYPQSRFEDAYDASILGPTAEQQAAQEVLLEIFKFKMQDLMYDMQAPFAEEAFREHAEHMNNLSDPELVDQYREQVTTQIESGQTPIALSVRGMPLTGGIALPSQAEHPYMCLIPESVDKQVDTLVDQAILSGAFVERNNQRIDEPSLDRPSELQLAEFNAKGDAIYESVVNQHLSFTGSYDTTFWTHMVVDMGKALQDIDSEYGDDAIWIKARVVHCWVESMNTYIQNLDSTAYAVWYGDMSSGDDIGVQILLMSIQDKLEAYEETGNADYLGDVGNYDNHIFSDMRELFKVLGPVDELPVYSYDEEVGG